MHQDILLTVDYHDHNCVIRRRDLGTRTEDVRTVPTTANALQEVVQQAAAVAQRRHAQVIWIQESTTGWARVQALLGTQVTFLLANVLQLPLPPKAQRRKTDRLDTARLQREYLNGDLPLAHQPTAWWRQVRRLVRYREHLVRRQTASRNGINRYLAHETWDPRTNLWSARGQAHLRRLQPQLPGWDGLLLAQQLSDLDGLAQQLAWVQARLHEVYADWLAAQRLAAVRGIGVIAAVAIAARIGPIERFGNAEQLIAYAGLAPGVRQSDQTRRHGHIGGGGTDAHLRHYLLEATIWARQLPRYRTTYTRVARRRGNKIGRLVVARMLLRSVYKVLRDGSAFTDGTPPVDAAPRPEITGS